VIQASAGGFHTLALCDDNELYAWGSGTYGETGLGEFQSTNKPKLVKMPKEYVSNSEMNQITDEFEF
jgi:regulator of chromosome condensation